MAPPRWRPAARSRLPAHPPASSSSRGHAAAALLQLPRRILTVLLLGAVVYTVHWTASDYYRYHHHSDGGGGGESERKMKHHQSSKEQQQGSIYQATTETIKKAVDIDSVLDKIMGKPDDEEDGEEEDATSTTHHHRVAGLSCEAHGGPAEEEAVREMVYWRDIPRDARDGDFAASPLRHPAQEQFLTFEPDEGGWNNIRMAFETAVALAVAMGRTLVLPPKMRLYRLWDGGTEERDVVGFSDFFYFDSIAAEHRRALKVVTFQEFLEQEALAGRLLDPSTGRPTFPPDNRTDWTGAFWNFEQTRQGAGKPLWEWMRRNATVPLEWSFERCVVGFPSRRGKEAADRVAAHLAEVQDRDAREFGGNWAQRRQSYHGHPTPVNASAVHRLSEMLGSRSELCVYDERLQETKVVHAIGETSTGFRLLVHFYAFLFFEDWKQDLWTKRFIRDHFRYIDEINCAAARIVQQVRKKAFEFGNTNVYHSFHVRRGDFQYQLMHLSAEEIYVNNTRLFLPDGSTVYIATDEGNKTFFDPLREHYNLLFLDDFRDQVQSINKNYYGMLDQLVASRGEIFWGAFYSTFTGYINRMRGYHAQKESVEKNLNRTGEINSFYYVPKQLSGFRERMRTYHSLEPYYWQQEWPVAWRDIDFDVGEDDFDDR